MILENPLAATPCAQPSLRIAESLPSMQPYHQNWHQQEHQIEAPSVNPSTWESTPDSSSTAPLARLTPLQPAHDTPRKRPLAVAANPASKSEPKRPVRRSYVASGREADQGVAIGLDEVAGFLGEPDADLPFISRPWPELKLEMGLGSVPSSDGIMQEVGLVGTIASDQDSAGAADGGSKCKVSLLCSASAHSGIEDLSPAAAARLKLLPIDMKDELSALERALALPSSIEELQDGLSFTEIDNDLMKCIRKRGKGGRNPASDARLDPNIDPKKAMRIMANRMSAARSKLRQKLANEGQRVKLDMLASQKAKLASEMERLKRLCTEMERAQLDLGMPNVMPVPQESWPGNAVKLEFVESPNSDSPLHSDCDLQHNPEAAPSRLPLAHSSGAPRSSLAPAVPPQTGPLLRTSSESHHRASDGGQPLLGRNAQAGRPQPFGGVPITAAKPSKLQPSRSLPPPVLQEYLPF